MIFDDIRPEFRLYTDEDLASAFQAGVPIYVDTNILRKLWRMHPRPQRRVVEILRGLDGRIFLPHQARHELAAQVNGPTVLNGIPTVSLAKAKGLMNSAFGEVTRQFQEANPLHMPAGEVDQRITKLGDEIAARQKNTEEWFAARQRDLFELLGESPSVEDIKGGRIANPLVGVVSEVFSNGALLPKPGDDVLAENISEYEKRVNRDDPIGPGLTDKGKSQVADASGDYLMWRQIMDHCRDNSYSDGFILLTEETKADFWEERQGEASLRRVNPQIQVECFERTGGPMYPMTLSQFLSIAAPQSSGLAELQALVDVAVPKQVFWPSEAVERLLQGLRAGGNDRQATVIQAAAERGGFISRQEIGEVLGWGQENRYLTRFRMPADRIAALLADEGVLDSEAASPLQAVYDGPGEAIGYEVPQEFVAIVAEFG